MEFIKIQPNFGQWDIDQIICDLKSLTETNGYDWEMWAQKGVVNTGKYAGLGGGDMNLTSNLTMYPSIHDRLWRHSGRRYQDDAHVDDNDLYEMHPELEGTYLGVLIRKMESMHGPIRVRLHNRCMLHGLYWHHDAHAEVRHHLTLWTNPGHFLVWTDEKLKWSPTFDPEQAKHEFKIWAKFIPVDGYFRTLSTGTVIHGVANIGVGWEQPREEQSRCHLTFWPVIPSIR